MANGAAMTLRRTIAAALREGAKRSLVEAFVTASERPRDEGERRVRAVANLATVCLAVADLLDPRAHPAALEGQHDARDAVAAPRADVGPVEVAQGPRRVAAADAQNGWTSHDVDGTTVSACADRAGYPVMSVPREGRLRVVKGGRA